MMSVGAQIPPRLTPADSFTVYDASFILNLNLSREPGEQDTQSGGGSTYFRYLTESPPSLTRAPTPNSVPEEQPNMVDSDSVDVDMTDEEVPNKALEDHGRRMAEAAASLMLKIVGPSCDTKDPSMPDHMSIDGDKESAAPTAVVTMADIEKFFGVVGKVRGLT